jgi:hypothetical protein
MLNVWQQQVSRLNRLPGRWLICRRLQESNLVVGGSHAKGIVTDKLVPSLLPTLLRCPINFGVPGKNVHQDREDRYN